MSELNGKELQQYLFNIRDLESSCYKQRMYIMHLEKLLNSANHPRLYANKEYKKATNNHDPTLLLFLCGGIALAGAYLIPSIFDLKGLWDDLAAVISVVFAILVLNFVDRKWTKSDKKEVDKANKIIKEENNVLASKNLQIVEKAKKQVGIINREMLRAKQMLLNTEDALKKYYAQNIIYEKYRSFVPVTMFCEYFASGRCNTLVGHEGAYNIYESEIRLNLIIVKLDDIIKHLEQIEQNQYMLSNMIRENNIAIQNLSRAVSAQASALCRIEDSVDATNYYSSITAANTSYLSWLAYHDHLHNGY